LKEQWGSAFFTEMLFFFIKTTQTTTIASIKINAIILHHPDILTVLSALRFFRLIHKKHPVIYIAIIILFIDRCQQKQINKKIFLFIITKNKKHSQSRVFSLSIQ